MLTEDELEKLINGVSKQLIKELISIYGPLPTPKPVQPWLPYPWQQPYPIGPYVGDYPPTPLPIWAQTLPNTNEHHVWNVTNVTD